MPTSPTRSKVPVLIVGGGPAGLALACELGWRGVRCMLVERRDGTITHPRMNQVSARTMEFCRRWGIAETIRAESIPNDFPRAIHFVTSVHGHELARFEFPARNDEVLQHAPEAMQRCSQLYFDPILQQHASSLETVTLRYDTEFEGFERIGESILARLIDLKSGETCTIEARYLAACDGAESPIREALGIDMIGFGALSYDVNILFRSTDHETLFPQGRSIMRWIFGDEGLWGDIVAVNGRDLWRMGLTRLPMETPVTKADAARYIRKAVGKDFTFDVVSILPWIRREQVAAQFGDGAVFLVGDSAHQMSTTGGFGMNTGIAEAVDLGWKLAAVLEGWGGGELLESYQAERHPVAMAVTAEGTRNFTQLTDLPTGPGFTDDSAQGATLRNRFTEFAHANRLDREYILDGIILGYRYEGSPTIWPDDTDPTPFDVMTYVPSARPGHRAPHAWLADGRSTLDLFGRGFTLLRLGAEAPDVDAVVRAAADRRLPLTCVDVADPEICRLYQRRLVLVRPDGHVAWRDDSPPADPVALIDRVRGATPR